MNQLDPKCYKKVPIKFLIETRFLVHKLLFFSQTDSKNNIIVKL